MIPVLFKIGSLTIYSYGFFLAVAFLIATFLIWRQSKKRGFEEEKILDFVLFSTIGGFLFARLFFVFLNFDQFHSNLKRTLFFWDYPGFFALGGAFGAIIFGVLYLKKNRWPIFSLFDITVCGLSCAHVIERLGSFLGGTSVGSQTNFSFGGEALGFMGRRHPVSLYEAGYDLVLAILLFFLLKKRKFPGFVTGCYAILYPAGQMLLWFFREKQVIAGEVHLTFIVAPVIMSGGMAILYFLSGRKPQKDAKSVKDFGGRSVNKVKSGLGRVIAKRGVD